MAAYIESLRSCNVFQVAWYERPGFIAVSFVDTMIVDFAWLRNWHSHHDTLVKRVALTLTSIVL